MKIGKVRVGLGKGTKEVVGLLVGKWLAVTPAVGSAYDPSTWTVTHMLTGLGIPGLEGVPKSVAVSAAKELSDLDWSREGVKVKGMRDTVLAVAEEAKRLYE